MTSAWSAPTQTMPFPIGPGQRPLGPVQSAHRLLGRVLEATEVERALPQLPRSTSLLGCAGRRLLVVKRLRLDGAVVSAAMSAGPVQVRLPLPDTTLPLPHVPRVWHHSQGVVVVPERDSDRPWLRQPRAAAVDRQSAAALDLAQPAFPLQHGFA